MTSPLRILALGGLGEIGMNCMVMEIDDEIIVIDCGILFSDLDHFGVEFVIPDFAWLVERKDKVRAIILTHGHEDHIGALPFLLKSGIRAPLYATHFTSLMIRKRLDEYGLMDSVDMNIIRAREKVELGKFSFTPESVNHSIVDAVALLIDTPLGRVIHTGDFKIDPTPFYGSMMDLSRFKKAGEEGVLLLLSDSTNVERCEHSMSESRIYERFEALFAAAEGLTVVAMFASNVARMGQILEIASKLGKKVILSGRSMEANSRLAVEAGYLKEYQSVLISLDDLHLRDRKDVIVISSGSQAEQGAALLRMAQGEHKQIQLGKGDLVLMSSRYIPGNEKAIGRMINQLFKQGAEVLYEAVHDIHASGHATKPELKQMIEAVNPRYFVPIHGEYRHLVHHARLAGECGLAEDRRVVAVNGDILEITPDSIRVAEKIEEPRVLVEGREGNDVSKLVLKDRRQLGEKGVVFSLLVRNRDSRRIIAGPDIIARGLASEQVESWLLEEAKNRVRHLVQEHELQMATTGVEPDLQENIRIELRRFFLANLGKKPTVMPIILDL
ncbi:MAG: ribonuclease J [Bdellovibrionales bacterium]|nr:ribonuclease J [Bdellovibrionales bacterium]